MPRRLQAAILIALLVATAAVQAVVVSRAAVPALDAVRFVGFARQIEADGLAGFLRECPEPPLFAVSVWTSHALLKACLGDFREAWAVSAQLAAAFPLILLPLPVFWLAQRFVGPGRALAGTLLTICLPELIRLGADGISDSTHLLLFSITTVLLVVHLSPQRPRDRRGATVLLAGIATALALLARSESVVLIVAFGAVLMLRGLRLRAVPWRSVVPYAAGIGLILVPYGVIRLSPSPAPIAPETAGPRMQSPASWRLVESKEMEKFSFAPKEPSTSIRKRGHVAAFGQLAEELPKAFGYLPGIFGLAGAWTLRRRPSTDADRLLRLFCLLFLGAVFYHTAREGYLAARHLLPVAMVAAACMGVGAEEFARMLRGALARRRNRETLEPRRSLALAAAVAAVLVVYGAKPLHASRSAHRSAADWLAHHAGRSDRVIDTRGWTGLYSGLATVPYEQAASELNRPGRRYLVVEEQEFKYDSRRGRTIRWILARAGPPVAKFPGRGAANVHIYAWNMPPETERHAHEPARTAMHSRDQGNPK